MKPDQTIQQKDSEEPYITLLRNRVEQKAGFSLQTPKNYEELKSLIEDQGQSIGLTTLMRLWGYVSSKGKPAMYTLSVLSRFVGYEDWNDFCKQNPIKADPSETENPQAESNSTPSCTSDSLASEDSPKMTLATEKANSEEGSIQTEKSSQHHSSRLLVVATTVILAFLLAMVAYFAYNAFTLENKLQTMTTNGTASRGRLLVCGKNTFQHPQDYLALFGIPNKEPLWCQQLPTHERIFVFTTTYKNKEWHNDGDASSLYPTITDYKTSASASNNLMLMELDSLTNRSRYYEFVSKRPIFIMFMNNLNYNHLITFLGVYRLSIPRSNIHHLVWERVAREVDLNNLGLIEQYLDY